MSIREELAQLECRLLDKQSEVEYAKEQLKAKQIDADNAEQEYEIAKGIVEEYQESVDNLQKEYDALDDQLTDLKEARAEQPV